MSFLSSTQDIARGRVLTTLPHDHEAYCPPFPREGLQYIHIQLTHTRMHEASGEQESSTHRQPQYRRQLH